MELQFHFDISSEKQVEFQSRIDNGEIISIDEIKSKYSPNLSDTQSLNEWLVNNNLEYNQFSYL